MICVLKVPVKWWADFPDIMHCKQPYHSLLQFANELMGQCVLAHTLGEIPCHAFPCRAGAKVCLLEAAIVSIESYRAGRGVILYTIGTQSEGISVEQDRIPSDYIIKNILNL